MRVSLLLATSVICITSVVTLPVVENFSVQPNNQPEHHHGIFCRLKKWANADINSHHQPRSRSREPPGDNHFAHDILLPFPVDIVHLPPVAKKEQSNELKLKKEAVSDPLPKKSETVEPPIAEVKRQPSVKDPVAVSLPAPGKEKSKEKNGGISPETSNLQINGWVPPPPPLTMNSAAPPPPPLQMNNVAPPPPPFSSDIFKPLGPLIIPKSDSSKKNVERARSPSPNAAYVDELKAKLAKKKLSSGEIEEEKEEDIRLPAPSIVKSTNPTPILPALPVKAGGPPPPPPPMLPEGWLESPGLTMPLKNKSVSKAKPAEKSRYNSVVDEMNQILTGEGPIKPGTIRRAKSPNSHFSDSDEERR